MIKYICCSKSQRTIWSHHLYRESIELIAWRTYTYIHYIIYYYNEIRFADILLYFARTVRVNYDDRRYFFVIIIIVIVIIIITLYSDRLALDNSGRIDMRCTHERFFFLLLLLLYTGTVYIYII